MSQLDRSTFGPHLRQLRQQAGLSQRIAASHAGITRPQTWQRWENGGLPQIWRAPAIAHAIGYSLVDLLEPDPSRIWVADLTITPDALARVRKHGTPELARIAEQVAEHAKAKVAELAASPPHNATDPSSRAPRPAAQSVRSRLASHARARAVELDA